MKFLAREQVADWAAILCRGAVFATIVVSSTQWDVFSLRGAHVSLVDPLILFAALCWIVRGVARGDGLRMSWLVPWQVVAFVFPAVLSIFMVGADGVGDALRELFKVFEYFVVGYILYADLLRHHPQRMRTVFYLALGVVVLIVLLALGQFFACRGDPVGVVCGTFKSRNVLGGWLAMMLPIVFGVALYARDVYVRAGLWLVVAVGLLVILSAAALGAVLGVMLLIAATRGWRTFAVAVLAATFWVAVVTGHVGRFNPPDAPVRVTSQQVLFESVAFYKDGQPERRYPQWQTALEVILTHPWLGVGIGNYQRCVKQYTGTTPLPTGPSEPDIQNLYLVIGSTMGLPALFGFLAMLLGPAFGAGTAAHRYAGWRKGLLYGMAGGLAAFAVTAIWHPLLVRGIGLQLALLLVVARLLAEWSRNQAPDVLPDVSTGGTDHAGDSSRQQRHRRRWRSPEYPPNGAAGNTCRRQA
ncbi:MAG: O-antigen ligase family protein [Kiritimatiellia bacterium]